MGGRWWERRAAADWTGLIIWVLSLLLWTGSVPVSQWWHIELRNVNCKGADTRVFWGHAARSFSDMLLTVNTRRSWPFSCRGNRFCPGKSRSVKTWRPSKTTENKSRLMMFNQHRAATVLRWSPLSTRWAGFLMITNRDWGDKEEVKKSSERRRNQQISSEEPRDPFSRAVGPHFSLRGPDPLSENQLSAHVLSIWRLTGLSEERQV